MARPQAIRNIENLLSPQIDRVQIFNFYFRNIIGSLSMRMQSFCVFKKMFYGIPQIGNTKWFRISCNCYSSCALCAMLPIYRLLHTFATKVRWTLFIIIIAITVIQWHCNIRAICYAMVFCMKKMKATAIFVIISIRYKTLFHFAKKYTKKQ